MEERRRIEAGFARQEAHDQDGSLLGRPLGAGSSISTMAWKYCLHVSARNSRSYQKMRIRSFIERTENGWLVLVDDSVAKEKISQLLSASSARRNLNFSSSSSGEDEDHRIRICVWRLPAHQIILIIVFSIKRIGRRRWRELQTTSSPEVIHSNTRN
jgi:hypothetical protein